jgi:sarcosine oxidase subunit gamma
MSERPPEARRSPLEGWYEQHATARRLVADMSLPSALAEAVPRGTAVVLSDLSWRSRCGCKGPGAPAWLEAQGFVVPEGANRWLRTDGVVVARLATSEFLVEAVGEGDGAGYRTGAGPVSAGSAGADAAGAHDAGTGSAAVGAADGGPAARVARARQQLAAATCPPGVYPVARHDLVVRLSGPSTVDLLRQTCSVDFAPLLAAAGAAAGPVVFTSMIGVGVLALPASAAGGPDLTLWCDPSFAHYFWSTLLEVAADLGGGVALAAPAGS